MRINDVDEWVRSVSDNVERFYPTAAAKATGLPLGAVYRQLIGLAHIGWLDVAYEVRCVECNVTLALELVVDPTILYEKEYSCHICGDDVEVNAENVFPIFLVRGDWSAGLKKVPAVNGWKAYPIGGEPISIGGLSQHDGVSWLDTVLPPEDIRALRELADEVPEIKRLVTELRGNVPRDARERRSRLSVFKEVGETANVWADVIKKVGFGTAPLTLANSPTLPALIERLLSAFGLS